jgi:hypothetical protein
VQPLVLTLQFIVSTSSGSEYFPFPVQVTLVQYAQGQTGGSDEDFYREVPIRTVEVNLMGKPVTTTFYYDPKAPLSQFVRMTKITKI